jgi:hypothetical protein
MSAFSRVHDISSACLVFECMLRNNRIDEIYSINNWNVLLKCIGDSCGFNPQLSIDCESSLLYHDLKAKYSGQTLAFLDDCLDTFLPYEALENVFKYIIRLSNATTNPLAFYPNSQTFCIVASAYADGDLKNRSNIAIELLKDAKTRGIPGDGRFLNAIIRCFGDDIDEAIEMWRSQIRSFALKHDNYKSGGNVRACYHALCWVAGKARRPDLCLRVIYAMQKELIEVTETAANCYMSGKRSAPEQIEGKLMKQYENLLMVECSKYDQRDTRRKKDTRLRIIL